MKIKTSVAASIAGLTLISAAANAQSWSPPAPEARCPSKWGAADERGAANLMTAESVLAASKLIRSGEVIELGRVLSMDMPLVRHAPLRHSHQTHGRSDGQQQALHQRGTGDRRDRPGRNAVRHVFPPEHRQQATTTVLPPTKSARATDSPSWAWRRSDRSTPRRADRRGGSQGASTCSKAATKSRRRTCRMPLRSRAYVAQG